MLEKHVEEGSFAFYPQIIVIARRRSCEGFFPSLDDVTVERVNDAATLRRLFSQLGETEQKVGRVYRVA